MASVQTIVTGAKTGNTLPLPCWAAGTPLVFTPAHELDSMFLLAQHPPPQNLPIFKPAWPRGQPMLSLAQDVTLDPGQRRTSESFLS